MKLFYPALTALLLLVAGIVRAEGDASWAQLERVAALTSTQERFAAEPISRRASVQAASAGIEEQIAAACRSSKPVLILDNFKGGGVPAYIDVDGDGKPDVAHGDVIAALYRASGKEIITSNLRGDGSIPNLAELLVPIADKLDKGEIELSAVNISQTLNVSVDAVGRDLHLPVSAADFSTNRAAVNEGLIKLDADGELGYEALSRAAARIAAHGVPIVVAAGNSGPGMVNLLGFLPGAVSVGSLERNGSKSPSSADNSLVTLWRTGDIILRRTADGNVDVKGDGRGHFDRNELTGEATIASRFAGRPLSEVLIKTPTGGDFDILSRETPGGIARLVDEMPDALYATEDLIRFFKKEGEPYAAVMRHHAPYYDKTMNFPFKTGVNGTVVFDPAADGSSGQVGLLTGTSFAAASICLGR